MMNHREFLEDRERILAQQEKFIESAQLELKKADATLGALQGGVSCFGSARTPSSDPFYKEAHRLGRAISDAGYSVITGGGLGIMEAAAKGAHEGKSQSIGLLIDLPHEQVANAYLDISLNFRYFFTRKISFARHSLAFVAAPGGFGTLDELSEVLTLVQTKKMLQKPIILFNKDFWSPLLSWIQESLLQNQLISKEDLSLISLVDSEDEVLAILDKRLFKNP